MGTKAKKLMSQLAVIGWCQVGVSLIGYLVPYSFFAIKADSFPATPSYLRAGICGDGTDYACPDKDWVPIPSPSSLHIEPGDPRLPQSVRDRQGLRPGG